MPTTMCRLITVTLLSLLSFVHSANPIVPVSMADPHVRIFNDRAYLYSGWDASNTSKHFNMTSWKIYSSDDLVTWSLDREIFPNETFMGEGSVCWATDAAYRNGSYYFYFSNWHIDIGVMKGLTPKGPFIDELKKPMFPASLTGYKQYDPTVFEDINGEFYMIFGLNDATSYYFAARLSSDMQSLAEVPRRVTWIGTAQGGGDKPTLHHHNDTYYLSSGSQYSISDSVYGPWLFRNLTSDGNFGLTARAHGNFFTWRGQNFHAYCYFIDPTATIKWRQSAITYAYYRASDGSLVDDEVLLAEHPTAGVGVYDAGWQNIQAEWFMTAVSATARECPTSSSLCAFHVSFDAPNSYITFPNVTNIPTNATISFAVSFSPTTTVIDIRRDSVTGLLLVSCDIPSSPRGVVNVTCPSLSTWTSGDATLVFIAHDAGLTVDSFAITQ